MAFPGTGKIWMNGALVDWADAKIHVASHVVHYGSGVFEGARCYDTPRGSACFRLDAHLNRLFDSAKIYRMEPTVSYTDLHTAVRETIRANEMKACYIRPIVYRGYHTLGVNPFPCPVDTAILVWEWGAYLGQEALTNGVDVSVSSWARPAPNTFPTLAKTSANYANSSLIKMEAVVEGYSEGIALDTSGYLSEGSGQNLFLVRNGEIVTNDRDASILMGVTRASVLELANDLGIPTRVAPISVEDVYHADELFFSGTAVEVTAIREVDGHAISGGKPGPITRRIQDTFNAVVRGQRPEYRRWLSFARQTVTK